MSSFHLAPPALFPASSASSLSTATTFKGNGSPYSSHYEEIRALAGKSVAERKAEYLQLINREEPLQATRKAAVLKNGTCERALEILSKVNEISSAAAPASSTPLTGKKRGIHQGTDSRTEKCAVILSGKRRKRGHCSKRRRAGVEHKKISAAITKKQDNPYNDNLAAIVFTLKETDPDNKPKRKGPYKLVMTREGSLAWVKKHRDFLHLHRRGKGSHEALRFIIETVRTSLKEGYTTFESSLKVPMNIQGETVMVDAIADTPLGSIMDLVVDCGSFRALCENDESSRKRIISTFRAINQQKVTDDAVGMYRFLTVNQETLRALCKHLADFQSTALSGLPLEALKPVEGDGKALKMILKRLNLSKELGCIPDIEVRSYLGSLSSNPETVSCFNGRCISAYSDLLHESEGAIRQYLEEFQNLRVGLKKYILMSPHMNAAQKEQASALYENHQYGAAIHRALTKPNLAITNTKEILPQGISALCQRTLLFLKDYGVSQKKIETLQLELKAGLKSPTDWYGMTSPLKEITKLCQEIQG